MFIPRIFILFPIVKKNPEVVYNTYDNINNIVGRTKTKTKIKSIRNIRERRPTQVKFFKND